ncbi:MAG TPA: sigma-54 dependent transcriptional regulator [Candidatus Binataceae bacterium]|nr:sigma-54 dependent transcriptional regulator [Candidatus Binataceae bacterium]
MKDNARILVAEDDATTLEAWCGMIRIWGFDVCGTVDGEDALRQLHAYNPHVLISDLKMPRRDGLGLLKEMRRLGLDVPTLIISGEGDILDAVAAMKLGALDYVRKPIDPPHLRALLNTLTQNRAAEGRTSAPRQPSAAAAKLVGPSQPMHEARAFIEKVAPSTTSVMIFGESGTGKEVAAAMIHQMSPRRGGPYVAVNCPAIPETLMEAELFGYERGAFSGADRRYEGCFERANGGTLLLDEITEMKFELQAKLLRVLEERRLRRLGGSPEISFDVRVLATTNRSPQRAIREGRLRDDLYYRLSVISIELPPLRQRPEDIAPLIDHFIGTIGGRNGAVLGADAEFVQVLRDYSWPGNVRQLRNAVERAMVVSSGPLLSLVDLPPELRPATPGPPVLEVSIGGCSLQDVEREMINRTMEFAGGNKTRAAEMLGISLRTLYNRLERLDGKERPKPA